MCMQARCRRSDMHSTDACAHACLVQVYKVPLMPDRTLRLMSCACQVPQPRCSDMSCCACVQEHFEPMLNNPLMPAKALRLIARGLSSAVARGEAAPPSLADIRAALEADREEAEVAHLMSLLGCRL